MDHQKREKENSPVAPTGSSPMALMGSRRDGNSHAEDDEVSTTMRTAETLLRLLPMALCIAALVIMLKAAQSNDFGSLSYSDLGAFKYLVHANGICAGYSLLSTILVIMPRPSTMSRAWTFFFLDQVVTYIILAAGAVSMEVLYLAYKGDSALIWIAACWSFAGFCHRAMSSVIITFVAVACYALLSLISSYKLFSKYSAPVGYTSKGIETAATFQG